MNRSSLSAFVLTVVASLGLALAGLGPATAWAQTPEVVHVKVGKVVTFPLSRQPLRLAVEDPSVASAEVLPDGRVSVTGIQAGRTRLIGRDVTQTAIVIQVVVQE